MIILYKVCEDGAFVAGDTESGLTSYAHPTSTHADDARRNARKPAYLERLARDMLKAERHAATRAEYDARNTERLDILQGL